MSHSNERSGCRRSQPDRLSHGLFGALVLLGVACGSSTTSTGSSKDAGADQATASTSQCTANADCEKTVPPTLPANCAVASCDALQGTCVYSAKDEDNDGHAALDCKSTNGVAILAGDDCDDHDANLYPGHSKPCMTEADGGTPPGVVCKPGAISCLSNGSVSGCMNVLSCVDQVCVNGACQGACGKGEVQCSGNGVETCTPEGAWSAPASCVDQTCEMGACTGVCAPNQTMCSGNAVALCGPSGAWGAPMPCSASQTCAPAAPAVGDAGVTDAGPGLDAALDAASDASGGAAAGFACQGVCGPGQLNCAGQQPQACDATGQWTSSGAACAAGQVCQAGVCAAGCMIDMVFYAGGTTNPNGACQTCQPSMSTTAWTNVADGASCGNGQVCAMGQCGTQCNIAGTVYATGVLNPMNACQDCQPGTSTSAWANLATGTSCGAGEVCNGTSCAAACFINNMLVTSGTVNPGNPCEVCKPATSTTAWSPGANGASCGAGSVCSAGSCSVGCFIGGTVESPGLDPTNACIACQPSTSTTSWTTVAAQGASCGAGEVCNGAVCQSGCFIGGVVYTPGQANPNIGCSTCQPSVSTTAWTVAAGATCANGGTCSAGVCTVTFSYTGASQTFNVPPTFSQVTITTAGAAGGAYGTTSPGGFGGSVTATLSVTPAELLTINVGGVGNSTQNVDGYSMGGFNGGGAGGYPGYPPSGGGGSDVRIGGVTLGKIVIEGGGGGGANNGGQGGAGGNATGESGFPASGGGGGGTQTMGGAGGAAFAPTTPGGVGGAGMGGTGANLSQTGPGFIGGAGGGGGYFGGGGGASGYQAPGAGGGGGSSYAISTATNVSMQQGVHSGNGLVTVSYGP